MLKRQKKGKPRKVGHVKMFIIDDLKASTVDSNVSEYVDQEAIIDSDNSTSYTNLKTLVKETSSQVIKKEDVSKVQIFF
jgi:hypothetical protein